MYRRVSHRLNRAFARLIALSLALTWMAGAELVLADPGQLYAHMEPVSLDSGSLANPGNAPVVVFSETIDLGSEVPWVRVIFSEASLPAGSFVRVTSLLDGESQILEATTLAQWGNGTAFFNGSIVTIELIAGPRTVDNYVRLEEFFVGDPAPEPHVHEPSPHGDGEDPHGGSRDICAGADARIASTDPRVGRLLPGGKPSVEVAPYCTAFIIDSPPGPDKLHLTAGHCFGNYYQGQMTAPFVLQFDVLPSVGCVITHPGVLSQFPVDVASVISTWPGFDPKPAGNDWAVFRCHWQAGVSTFLHAGAAFTVVPPPALPADVRVTGFGIDGADTVAAHPAGHPAHANECGGAFPDHCDATGADAAKNGTLQTAFGPLVANVPGHKPTVLNLEVDICAANSGSPIIINWNQDTLLGGQAIGILTHGGCKAAAPDDHNHGQTITTTVGLWNAIKYLKDKPPVPTLSAWGLIVMAVVLLSAAAIVVRRRRGAAVSGM